MPITFTPQRITDQTLGAIQREIQALLGRLGVKTQSVALRFGNNAFSADANYYELDDDSIARSYRQRLSVPAPGRFKVPPLVLNDDMGSDLGADIIILNRGYRGFSYLSKVGNSTFPAVFVNGSLGMQAGNDFGEVCHTLVHETIHMHSYRNLGLQAQGYFRGWSKFNALVGGAENAKKIFQVFDEGVTEFFARIVRHRLDNDVQLPATQKPKLPILYGLPIYEYPLRVACHLAATYGLSVVAKAFFEGDQTLRKRLAKDAGKVALNRETLKALSELGISNSVYDTSGDAPVTPASRFERLKNTKGQSRIGFQARKLKKLHSLNCQMPEPVVLIGDVAAGEYRDPAWDFWVSHQFNQPAPTPPPPEPDENPAINPSVFVFGGLAAAALVYLTWSKGKR